MWTDGIRAPWVGVSDEEFWVEARRRWWTGGMKVAWKGRDMLKVPTDIWSLQEVIFDTQPEVLIETGSKWGGSAFFFGDLGVEVHSIDVAPPKTPYPHPNVTYYTGYSISPRNLAMIGQAVEGRRTMVVLDSDHAKDNVLAELDAYGPMVTPGCYLICEDTYLPYGPGDALAEWLPNHPEFVPDASRETWGLTMFPGGWLLKS